MHSGQWCGGRPETAGCSDIGRGGPTDPRQLSHGRRPIFTKYLEPFADHEPLRRHLSTVLRALPEPVQRDLMDDPRFRIALDEVIPGTGRRVALANPGPVGKGSRCVVLKPRLADYPEAFVCYVIAHELAHAYLRNGGWGEITDAESAADALAASWGFQRPARRPALGPALTRLRIQPG